MLDNVDNNEDDFLLRDTENDPAETINEGGESDQPTEQEADDKGK